MWGICPTPGRYHEPAIWQQLGQLGGHVRRVDEVELAHQHQRRHANPADPVRAVMLGRGPRLPGKCFRLLQVRIPLRELNQALDLARLAIELRRTSQGSVARA